MKYRLQGNIWKYFVYSLSQRRNFFPILAIYFLTLPDATAKMIGLYIAAGNIAGFFLEIPSGYLADRWGHKRTLVLSKLLMFLSTLCFILAESPWLFFLGAILFPIGFAFWSGTSDALMHNTLVGLKREKDFTKIMSKIGANVSLISVVIIFALPFLTEISILTPFYVFLVIDFIGLIVTSTIVNPPDVYEVMQEHKSMFKIAKDAIGTGFYPVAIFLGIITGTLIGLGSFREPYVQSLGFPIILIGSIMAFSRFIWFFVGHNVHKIEEKFKMKHIFLFEVFFFPVLTILAAYFNNPYLVGLLFAIVPGYIWARGTMMRNLVINDYVPDKRYKATMISINGQIERIVTIIVAFAAGFIMNISFKIGFYTSGIVMFLMLLALYPWVKKKLKSN